MANPTLQEYRDMVGPKACLDCGHMLPPTLDHYTHRGGWPVHGMPKQWLFITCAHCGYQNALSKLGVPRPGVDDTPLAWTPIIASIYDGQVN